MCRAAGSCAAAGAGRPAAAVSCRVAVAATSCRWLSVSGRCVGAGATDSAGCAGSHLLRLHSAATFKHPSPGPTSTQGPRRRGAPSAAAWAAWRESRPLRAAPAAVCARPHHRLRPLAAGKSVRHGCPVGRAPGGWRRSLPAPPSQDHSIVPRWTRTCPLHATGSLPPAPTCAPPAPCPLHCCRVGVPRAGGGCWPGARPG